MLENRLYNLSLSLFLILFFRASLDPLLNLTKISGGIGLGALLNLFVFIVFIYSCINARFQIPKSFITVWGLFILFGIISVFISPDKITSMRSFFSIITYWSLFNLAYFFIKDKIDVEFFIKYIIFSSVIPLLFVITEFFNPEASTTVDGFRLFGSFSHPNIFAFYLVLIATLCMFTFKTKVFTFSQNSKIIFRLIFLFCLICLVFTKTRSAWIAMSTILLIYGTFIDRKYLFLLLIIMTFSLFIPAVQERLFDMFTGVSTDDLAFGENLNSYAWRKLVWLSSWDFIANKPFLGHGYDTFSYYFLDFFPLRESTGFDAHNAYVQIAFDMGFLGLASYILIFLAIIPKLIIFYRRDKNGAVLIIALNFSYLITSYSDNLLFYLSYNWYFWSMNGMFYYFYSNLGGGSNERVN